MLARHDVPIDVSSPSGEYKPLWHAMQFEEFVNSFVPSRLERRATLLARGPSSPGLDPRGTPRSSVPDTAISQLVPAMTISRSIAACYQPENRGPSNQSHRR